MSFDVEAMKDELLELWKKGIRPMTPAVPHLPPPPRKAPTSKAPARRTPTLPTREQAPARVAKTFTSAPWTGEGEGEKVIIYAASGKGKTTLAATAPDPIFIGLDDGGRKVRNPITGEPVRHVPGIESFQDVRDALAQPGLFDEAKSVVIDTGTILELLAIQYVIDTIPHENGTKKITGIEDYGYGKGFTHLFDTMRLMFADLDGLIRRGKNVIILCQQCPVVVANAAGSNYLQDGPKLWAPGPDSKQSFTVRGFACEWSDHVFKLDYLSQKVTGGGQVESFGKTKEKAGKVTGDTTRAIFTMPSDPSFFAKTRTLTEPVISFESPADDSLWQLLFPQV